MNNSQLVTITDKEAWSKEYDYSKRNFEYRESVRAVVVDNQNRIAVQHVGKHSVYTLPGGGVEFGESVEESLLREVKEEVGATISASQNIGKILEVRYKPVADLGKIQLNHVFVCRFKLWLTSPQLTSREKEFSCELIWMKYDEAYKALRDLPEDLEDFVRFAQLRDWAILKLAKGLINN